MAKKSAVNRNEMVKRLVKQFTGKRDALKAIANDENLPLEERFEARLKLAKRDAIVMHPGPIIRGLELTAEVADGPQSVIVDEVHNGVPTRMAILARAVGKAR